MSIRIYFQKLDSLAYILVAASASLWVCRHSHLRSGLEKTHLVCNSVRFGRSRSTKVDDFGSNRKRVCDFLFVSIVTIYIYMYMCGPILHRF